MISLLSVWRFPGIRNEPERKVSGEDVQKKRAVIPTYGRLTAFALPQRQVKVPAIHSQLQRTERKLALKHRSLLVGIFRYYVSLVL